MPTRHARVHSDVNPVEIIEKWMKITEGESLFWAALRLVSGSAVPFSALPCFHRKKKTNKQTKSKIEGRGFSGRR